MYTKDRDSAGTNKKVTNWWIRQVLLYIYWFFLGHFSVIDRNDFEMTEKNLVISVKMCENIG